MNLSCKFRIIISTFILLKLICSYNLKNYNRKPKFYSSRQSIINPSINDNSRLDKLLSEFRINWQNSLRGNHSDLLNSFSNDLNWENPILQTNKRTEINETLIQFSNFFLEPSVIFFDTQYKADDTVEIMYQLSFWYPMPWRPRIIIPGKLKLKFDSNKQLILNIKEKWDISIQEVFTRQLPPRFWDLYHSFSSIPPESLPVKSISKIEKVEIVELPETIALEIFWTAASKFPVKKIDKIAYIKIEINYLKNIYFNQNKGPPIFTMPGFGLFGYLKTSRPNREPYYPILPIDVQSGAYQLDNGAEMKYSKWTLPIPTNLQEAIIDKANSGEVFQITSESLVNNLNETPDYMEKDKELERDYQVGLENFNAMKSIAPGTLRGRDTEYDENLMREFESTQKIRYRYNFIPKRLIAKIDVKGEPSKQKLSSAIEKIKTAIGSVKSDTSYLKFKNIQPSDLKILDQMIKCDTTPKIGFQIWNCKVGFNSKAQPSIAIYEQQYGFRKSSVYIELDNNTS